MLLKNSCNSKSSTYYKENAEKGLSFFAFFENLSVNKTSKFQPCNENLHPHNNINNFLNILIEIKFSS